MAAPILGDIIFRAVSLWTRLAGNTSATRKFLRQVGTGAASAAPAWDDVKDTDVVFTDNTTNNVSNTKHGYAPKNPNDATKYLDGTGAYTVPTGTGNVVGPASAVSDDFAMFNGTTGKIIKDNGTSLTLSVGTPGVDTLIPSEKAVRSAITAGGFGNVSTGVTLTSDRLIVGAGTSNIKVGDLTGDITTSGSQATTIGNDKVTTAKILDANVTLAKIANAAASSKLLGSGASGSGSPYSELAVGTGLSITGTTLNASGDGFWSTVVATIDQDVSSNTTPANDNELFFSLTAAKLYEFEAHIIYNSPAGSTTPDFKCNFNGPATLTGQYSITLYVGNADSFVGAFAQGVLTTTSALGTATTPRFFFVKGWVYSTGGGSGSSGLAFQWSQNVSGVNATRRLAGSLLRYRQLSV